MFVTPLYAGLLALWFLVLSGRVVRRRRGGASLGDGGDPALQRVVRGHATLPSMCIARLLHGYALSFTASFPFGRVWGTALTFVVLATAAVLCVYQGILGQWLWCCMR